MVGVGDELLLLFIALRHRPHHPLGEENGEKQDQKGTPQQHQESGHQQPGGHGPVHAAVDEDGGGSLPRLQDAVAVVGDPPPLPALLQRLLDIVLHVLPGDGRDGVHVDPQDLLLAVQPDGEEPGAELGLLRDDLPVGQALGGTPAVVGLKVGKDAVVGDDGVGEGVHGLFHLVPAEEDQQQKDDGKDRQRGHRADEDELLLQTGDHGLTSRV